MKSWKEPNILCLQAAKLQPLERTEAVGWGSGLGLTDPPLLASSHLHLPRTLAFLIANLRLSREKAYSNEKVPAMLPFPMTFAIFSPRTETNSLTDDTFGGINQDKPSGSALLPTLANNFSGQVDGTKDGVIQPSSHLRLARRQHNATRRDQHSFSPS